MSNSFNVVVAKFSCTFSWCLQVICLTLLIVICDLCQHISFLFIVVCDLCQHRHCPCLSIEKKLLFVICANTFHFYLLWFVICASVDNIFCPCPSIEKIVICDLWQHISFLFIVICSDVIVNSSCRQRLEAVLLVLLGLVKEGEEQQQ